jgi:hypothetical protein
LLEVVRAANVASRAYLDGALRADLVFARTRA